jgi:hypothetical protein
MEKTSLRGLVGETSGDALTDRKFLMNSTSRVLIDISRQMMAI